MEDKDAELGLGLLSAKTLSSSGDILLQLLDGVLEGGTGIINLIDNEDTLANQVGHLAQGSQIEPLGTGDPGTGGLNLKIIGVAELLVQRQTDSLDGDVGGSRLLEERTQDTGRDVATTADGDDELGLELSEQLVGRLLAQLVHLLSNGRLALRISVYLHFHCDLAFVRLSTIRTVVDYTKPAKAAALRVRAKKHMVWDMISCIYLHRSLFFDYSCAALAQQRAGSALTSLYVT